MIGEEREVDAPMTDDEIRAFLALGGKWIGNVRHWLQCRVQGGDTLPWASTQSVHIRFCDFTEVATEAARGALADYGAVRARVDALRGKLLRTQMELELVTAERDALRAKAESGAA